MPFLGVLGDAAMAELQGGSKLVHLPAGAVLMTEGDPADSVFVLVVGRLRAFVEQSDGSSAAVGDVTGGELVGEMSALSGGPRGATVRAVRDSQLVEIDRDVFDSLMERQPGVGLEMARELAARLERANRGRRGVATRRVVALVPSEGSVTPGVANAFRAAVSARYGVHTVTADILTEVEGETALVDRLHAIELDNELVLYVADGPGSAWANRCMRQADHIVVVDERPDAEVDRRTMERIRGVSEGVAAPSVDVLMVHHRDAVSPSGGARWLADASHFRVHHARRDNNDDFARVGRIITGDDVALVLSGGGARGFAHIGVVRALAEHGVPIDVVGGTSFGAVVSTLVAAGLDWEGVREVMATHLTGTNDLIDLTLPVLALSKGRKLMGVLEKGIGPRRLEDLWLRAFCVSSNLTTGHPLVHTEGDAVAAVRASVAIPGVFPPVRSDDGELLVDGGVMNNLPIDVMLGFADGGPLLAVNLRTPASIAMGQVTASGVVSGSRVLRARMAAKRGGDQVPSVVDVLLRTSETGASLAARVLEPRADHVFRPPVGDHAMLGFEALDDLVEAGYRNAVDSIESWSLELP